MLIECVGGLLRGCVLSYLGTAKNLVFSSVGLYSKDTCICWCVMMIREGVILNVRMRRLGAMTKNL